MQRSAINKRDALRHKEELIDSKLKDAGCWEVGQNFDDKLRIYEFLKESEASSNQNELRNDDASESSSSAEIKITPLHTQIDSTSSLQREDSPEPVIMYDSFVNKSTSVRSSQYMSSEEDLSIIDRNESLDSRDAGPSTSFAGKVIDTSGGTEDNENNVTCFSKIDQQAGNIESSQDMDVSITDKNQTDCAEPKSVPVVAETAADARPLKYRKIRPVEDPSKVYYQNATETKQEGFIRILGLINDYHKKLKIYQRTLPNSIPQPEWITLEDTTQSIPSTSGPHRLQRATHHAATQKSNDIYTFNPLDSESSAEEETNASDVDWISCAKKKPIKRTKRNMSPQHDLENKAPEAKKINGCQQFATRLQQNATQEITNGAAKTINGGSHTPNLSVKRKAFTLGPKTTTEVRTGGLEFEQSATKKQKMNSPNGEDIFSDPEDIQICPIPVIRRGRQYTRRPTLQFVNTEKEVEEPSQSVLASNDSSPVAPDPLEVELVPCPLCQKCFPIPRIEAHASDCMVEDVGPDLSLVRSVSDDVVCL